MFFQKKKVEAEFKEASFGHKLTESTISSQTFAESSSEATIKRSGLTMESKVATDTALARLSLKRGNPSFSTSYDHTQAQVKKENENEAATSSKSSSKSSEIELDLPENLAVSHVDFKPCSPIILIQVPSDNALPVDAEYDTPEADPLFFPRDSIIQVKKELENEAAASSKLENHEEQSKSSELKLDLPKNLTVTDVYLNSSDDSSRRRRTTFTQLETLWEFLSSNKEIATGFNKSAQDREYSRRLWLSVADALNSQGEGAVKDWKGWSSYWVDYKAKLKKKAALVRAAENRTEGGPLDVVPLSQLEKKFLGLLGDGFGIGLSNIQVDPYPTTSSNTESAACEPLLNQAEVTPTPHELVVDHEVPQELQEPQEALQAQPSNDAVEPVVRPERRRRRLRRESHISQEAARRTLVELSRERLQLETRITNCLEQLQYSLARIANSLDTPCSPIMLIEVPPDNVLSVHAEYDKPDADPLFTPPSDSASKSSPSRRTRGGRRVRGRVFSRRSPRGTVGARVASSAQHIFTTGDPITQVCVTDEDVPASLRQVVEEIIENRAKRDSRPAARTALRATARQLEEDFHDAEDEESDAVLLGGRNAFDWQPMSSFQAQREEFTPPRTGSVKKHDNMYDAFRSFWPVNILQHIVVESNRYAREITSPSFRQDWYDTNVHEILVLFSFWMMLGIIKLPTIKSCFTTKGLLKTNVFRKMFSQRRYVFLTRALRFVNHSDRTPNDSKLFCFGPILNHLNEAFQNNYIPGPQVSIDESLTLWKGVLNFRQYIKTKAARFGIKTFELCESVSGYLWSFIVYVGKDTRPTLILKSTSVVLDLIRPLLNKGYCLYMDNWFNSPTLARYLKGKNTDCVGTLRPSRCGVPPLLQEAVLQKGQLIARHCGDVSVIAWHDKKKVLMISTFHNTSTASVSNGHITQFKPQVVLDYNKYMGGVDLKDQMLEPYLLERKRCNLWYMKLFKRLLNASILNSRILLESSMGKKIDHLACRLSLVEKILENHLQLCPCKTNPSESDPLARLDTRHAHWPVRIPGIDSKNRQLRKRCVHCLKNRKPEQKTPFKCDYCDAPLCIDPCFKEFHAV